MVVEHHQRHVTGIYGLTGTSQQLHRFKDIAEGFRFNLLGKFTASLYQKIPHKRLGNVEGVSLARSNNSRSSCPLGTIDEELYRFLLRYRQHG